MGLPTVSGMYLQTMSQFGSVAAALTPSLLSTARKVRPSQGAFNMVPQLENPGCLQRLAYRGWLVFEEGASFKLAVLNTRTTSSN